MEGEISYKLDGICDRQAENRTEAFPLLIRFMPWLQALQDNASLTLKPERAQDHGCSASLLRSVTPLQLQWLGSRTSGFEPP